MAFTQRHLVSAFATLMLALLASTSLSAQSGGPESTGTFRTLCVAFDGQVSKLFFDHKGRQIALSASDGNFSPPYPRPADGTVSIYREVAPTPPETKPRRIPVTDVRIGPGGPWLLLLASAPNPAAPDQPRISAAVVDQSWEKHPAGSIQIFNFCRTPVAIQAGSDVAELAPSQSKLVPYPEPKEDFLWLKAAVQSNGEWNIRINTPQRIIHKDTRATWVMFDRPITAEHPKPRIIVRNLVDSAPPTP